MVFMSRLETTFRLIPWQEHKILIFKLCPEHGHIRLTVFAGTKLLLKIVVAFAPAFDQLQRRSPLLWYCNCLATILFLVCNCHRAVHTRFALDCLPQLRCMRLCSTLSFSALPRPFYLNALSVSMIPNLKQRCRNILLTDKRVLLSTSFQVHEFSWSCVASFCRRCFSSILLTSLSSHQRIHLLVVYIARYWFLRFVFLHKSLILS